MSKAWLNIRELTDVIAGYHGLPRQHDGIVIDRVHARIIALKIAEAPLKKGGDKCDEAQLSTQAALRMILQCLPDSPFKDTATRIIGGAVQILDDQELMISQLNDEIEDIQRLAHWSRLSEKEKDEAIKNAT